MLSRYREPLRAWAEPLGHALMRLRLRPNHLTLAGLGVSLLAAAAFVAGRTRLAGGLLVLAGLFDFFDGALARASGQVTPFGAFLDSVIDRYSDLAVLAAVVLAFAQAGQPRPALVAMAALVGSVMVSYTKARAESIGVACTVGIMERPERLICLSGGALLDVLEPALWVLAVLANVTALQRIVFTRRAARHGAFLGLMLSGCLAGAPAPAAEGPAAPAPPVEAWAAAVRAFQSGAPEPLVGAFSTPEALRSAVGDYVRYLLADALERVGRLAEAEATARAVAEHFPDSPLAPAALLMAATLADRADEPERARRALTRLVTDYPETPEGAAATYLLARDAEARGDREWAVRLYRQLRVEAPATGWAEGASERLAALAAAGVRVPELSPAQRLARAERLLSGGVPEAASEEADRLAREVGDPGIVSRALEIVADAARRLGRFEVAARTLHLAAARAPRDRRPALLLEEARLWRRVGQPRRALEVLAEVEARGSPGESAEAAYLRGRAQEELGWLRQAAATYRALIARDPARAAAGSALWRLGWIEFRRGEVRRAAEAWRRLADLPGGRAWRLAGRYWAGRALEQVGERPGAVQLYRLVLAEAPRSYYGLLAAARTTAEAAGPPGPVLRLPEDPRHGVAEDGGFVRAELLRRVGLVEFAIRELERVAARAVGDPVRLYGVSAVLAEDAQYHLALRLLRRHFAAPAATGDPGLPRAFWELLYPFPWRTEITEAAERHGLDPFLVAAVIREESSYHPQAVSRAGARGLMQLLPRTAEVVADAQRLPWHDRALEDLQLNLELGTAFLASLLREWRDPRLALAAYNAGPTRVRRWWSERSTDDLEAWVEQIPFDETRHYVKRVWLAWAEYRRIYGR
jgi:soluble lytic murein transglycosylase